MQAKTLSSVSQQLRFFGVPVRSWQPPVPSHPGPVGYPMHGEYLVWSFEHNAWWAPAQNGYVLEFKEAGRYGYQEAIQIMHQANQYAAQPMEIMVPLKCAASFQHRLHKPKSP
jgi:hypothetical protein